MSDTADMFRRFQRHPETLEQADTIEKFVELLYAGPASGHADAGVIEMFAKPQNAWTRYVFRTLKAHGVDTAPSRPLYMPEAKKIEDVVWDVRFLPLLEGGHTREENLKHVDHRVFLMGLSAKASIPFGQMGGARGYSPKWLQKGEKIRSHSGGRTYGTYARPVPEMQNVWRAVVGGVIDGIEFVTWDDGRTLVIAKGCQTFDLWMALLDKGEADVSRMMPPEDQKLIAQNKAADTKAWGDEA